MKYLLDAEGLKKQLLAAGYPSIVEFAKATGLHRNTVQKLLQGGSVFSQALQKIADRLQLDPVSLLQPVLGEASAIPHVEELAPLVQQLLHREPQVAVILFGSRASGRARTYSDWDLGLTRFPKPLGGIEFLRLKRWMDEVGERLVRTVDVVNLDQAPDWFLGNTAAQLRYLAGHREAWCYFQGVVHGVTKRETAA